MANTTFSGPLNTNTVVGLNVTQLLQHQMVLKDKSHISQTEQPEVQFLHFTMVLTGKDVTLVRQSQQLNK